MSDVDSVVDLFLLWLECADLGIGEYVARDLSKLSALCHNSLEQLVRQDRVATKTCFSRLSLSILGSQIGGSLVESLMKLLHLFISLSPIYRRGVKTATCLVQLNQGGWRGGLSNIGP